VINLAVQHRNPTIRGTRKKGDAKTASIK